MIVFNICPLSMKNNFLIFVFFVTIGCSSKSNLEERLVLSGALENFTKSEFNELIHFITESDTKIDLYNISSPKKYFEKLEKNYEEAIFFIYLPNISSNTYLPIYFPNNGPIIDISINEVIFLKSLNDIKGATKDFKLIFINIKDFENDELCELFSGITIDYLNSLKNIKLNITESNIKKIAKDHPLEIWVTVK